MYIYMCVCVCVCVYINIEYGLWLYCNLYMTVRQFTTEICVIVMEGMYFYLPLSSFVSHFD